MIAMEVLAMVRCLSCWRVSARAERPWLMSVGRSAEVETQSIRYRWVMVVWGKEKKISMIPTTIRMDVPSSKPSKFFSRYVFAL